MKKIFFCKLLVAGTACLVLCGAALSGEATDLRTAAQPSAPKYFAAVDNSVEGLCVDIIRAIERIDPTLHFSGRDTFIPFKRLQQKLANGEIDVFVGLKKTPKRMNTYRFIDIPLYRLSYKLVSLTHHNRAAMELEELHRIGTDLSVLTVNATAASTFLKNSKLRLRVDDSPRSPTSMIQMLIRGRGDFAFYHDLALFHTINKLELDEEIYVVPGSYSSYTHHVAFAKKVPIETIDRVRKALENLQKNGELARIASKYLVHGSD